MNRSERLAALGLGLFAFLIVVGPGPLDPTNIAWLADADAATNYLGWAYYRASPWGWPLAANPAYGLDIAGSVMMADANPLMALPFKLLSPLLPTPFQYFGWWLLLCFLLQAWFAHAIATRLSTHVEQRLAIVGLFLFVPFFLIRIATPAVFHMTLVGQWQIVAAFWLYLSPDLRRRALGWMALLVAAVLTHPYLLALVVAIWLADLFRSLIAAREPLPRIVFGAVVAMIAMIVVAKISGVFWLQRLPDGGAATMSVEYGFGAFKANAATLIDPGGWSLLLPDIATAPERIEGFAFLGLGVLLLALASLPRLAVLWPQMRIAREHVPLLVILAACALFALSNDVEIGHRTVRLPWPDSLVGIGNMFRSTGRFIWPVAYAALLVIVWAVAHGWRRRTASILLIATALIQLVDTSAGWSPFRRTFAQQGSSWPTGLAAPFWARASGRYRAVRLLIPRNHVPYYRDLNAWALANGMASDVIYLARYDRASRDRLAATRADQFANGTLPRDTLWIIEGMSHEALIRMRREPGDFVGIVDGLPLFAPGFRTGAR